MAAPSEVAPLWHCTKHDDCPTKKFTHDGVPVTQVSIWLRAGSSDEIQCVAEALKTNHTLLFLKVHYGNLGEDGLYALSEALRVNKTLEFFALSEATQWTVDCMRHFATTLRMNGTLKGLDLFDTGIDPEIALCLADGIRANSRLEFLGLSANELLDAGTEHITGALRDNGRIQGLHLACQPTGPRFIPLIVGFLENSMELTELKLQGTGLTAQKIEPLMNHLKVNRILTDLDISHNELDARAARSIGEMLATNTTLRTLRLIGNTEIRDAGAVLIAAGLQKNNTLQSMQLHLCGIEGPGVRSIVKAVEENTSLRVLLLACNRADGDTIAWCIDTLQTNFTLTCLRLHARRPGYTWENLGKLEHLMLRNRQLRKYTHRLQDTVAVYVLQNKIEWKRSALPEQAKIVVDDMERWLDKHTGIYY